MHSGAGDSYSTATTSKIVSSSSQYDDIHHNSDRLFEIKNSLAIWRNILLPLNNLLEWEHKYDPLILFGLITIVFAFILSMNPPVLTLLSCLMLIFVFIDFVVPIIAGFLFKNENWNDAKEAKYTRLCERIVRFEQHIKSSCDSALKMRKERPLMYLMIGVIILAFFAYAGQCVDNLLLTYLTTLAVCLVPGIRNRKLIPMIRERIVLFWNNKKNSITSKKPPVSTNGPRTMGTTTTTTTTRSTVYEVTKPRPSSNATNNILFSTSTYNSGASGDLFKKSQ